MKLTFSSISAVIAIEEAPFECSDASAAAGSILLSESLDNNIIYNTLTCHQKWRIKATNFQLYKINKYLGRNVQHDDYSYHSCMVYRKAVKRA